MRPIDVTDDNSLEVHIRMKRKKKHQKSRYAVGDAVKIAKNKQNFEKSYRSKFQEELYFIIKVMFHERPVDKQKTQKSSLLKANFTSMNYY